MRKGVAFFFVFLLVLSSCGKKIPPPELFDPGKAFEEANAEFEKKHYEEARRRFGDIRQKDFGGEYAPLAQLRIADAYLKDDDPETAADEYRRFLDEYPRHKFASYAQHQVGLIYYEMILGPERGYGAAVRAREEFRKLMDLYPRNPYRDSVLIKIERCNDVIAEHEFLVGDFYFKKKAYNGALGRLLPLLEDFPGYKDRDEAYYRIAVSFKGVGKDEKAGQYLDLLRESHPGSGLVEKAEEAFEEIMKERRELIEED